MDHPAVLAMKALETEVMRLVGDKSVQPGTQRWFEMQAKGCALSMLRGMIDVGAHNDPRAAESYRKAIPVKSLPNWSPDELEQAQNVRGLH